MAELSSAALGLRAHVTKGLEQNQLRSEAWQLSLGGGAAEGATAAGAPFGESLSDPALEAAFRRAAVVQVYGPGTLMAASGNDVSPDIARALARVSFTPPGQGAKRLRSLNREVRLVVLRGLDAAGARALIDAAPDREMTRTQEIFEAVLDHRLAPLDSYTLSDLAIIEEVGGWSRALGAKGPDPDALTRARLAAEAVSSFQHLVGESFVGRDDQLRAMREILGIDDPSLRRRIGAFFSGGAPRAVFLEGVGGIGKTALIGHFLREFRDAEGRPRFGFAYIPCDDPGFDVLDPRVLLQEAADQLASQVHLAESVPGLALFYDSGLFARFEQTLYSLAFADTRSAQKASDFASQEERFESVRMSEVDVWKSFADLVTEASRALARGPDYDLPAIVLIVDSFEEVQGRARETQTRFWEALETILAAAPALRVVISGRSPLMSRDLGVPTYRETLSELDEDESVSLLQEETGEDEPTIRSIVRHIGRNPLNLRLAGRVLAEEEESAASLKAIPTRSWFTRLGPEIIRGRLYQRVLDHIDDEDPRLRKLVHPGMVLRRVTPDIITEVLAPVCGIEVKDANDAKQLFAALEREHTLVRIDGDGSLRYNRDIREPVLALLEADQPEMTRRAHEAAIAYYAGLDDPVSVAEHLYHLLMLGDVAEAKSLTVSGLTPEIRRHLETSLEELPPGSQIFLAGLLSLEISDELHAQADAEEWERIVGPRALQALLDSGPEPALKLLGERAVRTPSSPLVAIEARAWLSLEQYDRAEQAVRRGLAELPATANPGRRAELLWLLAQAQLQSGRREEGVATMIDLAGFAQTLTTPIARVQVLGVLVDLLTGKDDPRLGALRQGLFDALAACPEELDNDDLQVLQFGFSRLTTSAAGALPAVAFQVIGPLYVGLSLFSDDDAESALSGPHFDRFLRWVQKNKTRIAAASNTENDGAGGRDPRDRAAALSMLQEMESFLADPESTSAPFMDLLSILRARLALRRTSREFTNRLAAEGTWYLTQFVAGSMRATGLGGLAPYRETWARLLLDGFRVEL